MAVKHGLRVKRVGKIQAAEIKFLGSVGGCSRLHDITSVDVQRGTKCLQKNG